MAPEDQEALFMILERNSRKEINRVLDGIQDSPESEQWEPKED